MKILYKIANFFLQPSLGVSCIELKDWKNRKFHSPSPHHIKQTCLLRHAVKNATWIETGTFMGDTTALLAAEGGHVYSIEPEPDLYNKAKIRFAKNYNVNIINSPSEDAFPILLKNINGNVNFWLDGHYSGGITFQGKLDTPIQAELFEIAANLSHFQKVTVLVDDVRCFNPKEPDYAHYPSVDFLVDWARSHDFTWAIEHDIFIAKNY
jgi:hypothetical protein